MHDDLRPLLAVYGLLRRGQPGYRQLKLSRCSRVVGPCALAGTLYDAGGYPAFVPGEGVVQADLLQLTSAAVLPEIDAYEQFDPEQPEDSLFVRARVMPTSAPPDSPPEVWTYLYNKPVKTLRRIRSGDWLGRRFG